MFVVSWSPQQGYFHVDSLQNELDANWAMFAKGKALACYLPIACFNTIEEAMAYAREAQPQLDNYRKKLPQCAELKRCGVW